MGIVPVTVPRAMPSCVAASGSTGIVIARQSGSGA